MRNDEDILIRSVHNAEELTILKQAYLKLVGSRYDKHLEIDNTILMHRYRFDQSWRCFDNAKVVINPYLHFFINRMENYNLFLKKGVCVMYPSSILTDNVEAHVKFLGKPGDLLIWMSENKNLDDLTIYDIIIQYTDHVITNGRMITKGLIVNMLKHLISDQLITIKQ